MTDFKKKLFAGILGSALLLTGSQAFARPMPPPPVHMNQEQMSENISGWVKHLSEVYGVDKAQIESALTRGVHIHDVQQALILSKLSGKNFSDVLAMKVDWPQVAEKLGVKREQVEEFHRQQMLEMLAHNSGVDTKTAESLLKDGYKPKDITIAGKIAQAAGKDIKSVLGKRKINNTWSDVAKSFGVDIRKFMPKHEQPPIE